jgi:hypothetical protein
MGQATLPLLSESIPKVADIVVSKSKQKPLIHYGLNQIKLSNRQGITTVDNIT